MSVRLAPLANGRGLRQQFDVAKLGKMALESHTLSREGGDFEMDLERLLGIRENERLRETSQAVD